MSTNASLVVEDDSISNAFQSLQKQLTYIVLIPLFLIGNIGCVFNTIIFRRPYLRSSSCSRYFLASSFANVFQLNIGLGSHILDFAFTLHPHYHSSILCKFRNYSINIAGFLSQTYLLLACADRYLITVNKSSSRRLHRVPMANRIILVTAVFWLVTLSHMLIYSDVTSRNRFCFYTSSSYVFFISLHNLTLSGFVLPILMVVFSALTLKNMHRIRQHIRSRRRPRRQHYLSLMLISNVFVSVIFTTIYTSGLIYITFFTANKGHMSSAKEKSEQRFVMFLAILFYYVPYAVSFYVNVLTSERFRHELSKIWGFRQNKNR